MIMLWQPANLGVRGGGYDWNRAFVLSNHSKFGIVPNVSLTSYWLYYRERDKNPVDWIFSDSYEGYAAAVEAMENFIPEYMEYRERFNNAQNDVSHVDVPPRFVDNRNVYNSDNLNNYHVVFGSTVTTPVNLTMLTTPTTYVLTTTNATRRRT